MSEYQVTVVPHTHWDREWYQPFSVFQARLVETVDRVLELLESRPGFTHFMLDGQAVVLEDYLAVRPEAETAIRALVQDGRLAIGPWYTLADEFLASPEALVRNLHVGVKICRRFGGTMGVVYTPDSFGHVSVLPRLAHDFGFDSVVFERGVGNEGERLRGEFLWAAPDGRDSVLAVNLFTTYASAAAIGYRDWRMQDGFDPDLAVAHAEKALYGTDARLGIPEWLEDSFDRIRGGSAAYATGRHLLLLNGSDHLLPQANIPQVIDLLNHRVPNARFALGTLRRFIDGVLSSGADLARHQGEFRGSRYHHVLSGVFSARMYLKQANHRAQLAVERYAEPLSALAYLAGARYPDAVLETAWKNLLRNHAHDSICGCSIDTVHDEMMPRFAAVLDTADHLAGAAIDHLSAGRAETGGGIAVFNPLPHPWRGVLRARIAVEKGGGGVGIVGPDGAAAPGHVELERVPAAGDARRSVDVASVAWLAELPPLSVTPFRLTDAARAPEPPAGIVTGSVGHLENELLRLEVEGDTLTCIDKASGVRVPVRLALEDEGDAGDEYDFSPVLGADPRVLDLGAMTPHLEEPNPFTRSLRFEADFELPERLSDDRKRREGSGRMPVALRLAVEAASPFIHVDLRVTNTSRDHRLRLRLDTDIVAERVAVEGHFDVLERSVALPDERGWFQKPSGTEHQRRFLAIDGTEYGLAVLNAGLPEYAAEALPGGTRLSVTLLRCVGWLSRNDLLSRPEGAGPALPTPGAQCIGEHRFDLALMPYAGRWDEAGVPRAAERFTVPPRVGPAPRLPGRRALLEIPEGTLLSALKKAEGRDAVVVRLWNPGARPVEGPLRLTERPASARLLRLDETPRRDLEPSTEVPLLLQPKEIITLELTFGGDSMR